MFLFFFFPTGNSERSPHQKVTNSLRFFYAMSLLREIPLKEEKYLAETNWGILDWLKVFQIKLNKAITLLPE